MVVELAATGNFGYDRLLTHTPDQIRWLYDESERVRAASRAGYIDDMHVVIAKAFSEPSSDGSRAADDYVKRLRKIGGFTYTEDTPNVL